MFSWTVEDPNGSTITTSETFSSREDAEAWMGAEWSRLAEAGGKAVVLMDGTEVVYRMSLDPE